MPASGSEPVHQTRRAHPLSKAWPQDAHPCPHLSLQSLAVAAGQAAGGMSHAARFATFTALLVMSSAEAFPASCFPYKTKQNLQKLRLASCCHFSEEGHVYCRHAIEFSLAQESFSKTNEMLCILKHQFWKPLSELRRQEIEITIPVKLRASATFPRTAVAGPKAPFGPSEGSICRKSDTSPSSSPA